MFFREHFNCQPFPNSKNWEAAFSMKGEDVKDEISAKTEARGELRQSEQVCALRSQMHSGND